MMDGQQAVGAALRNLEPTLANSFLPLVKTEPKAALQLAYLSGLSHGVHLHLTAEEAAAFEDAVANLVKKQR